MKEKLILLHKALVIGRFVKIFCLFFLKDYYKYLMKHVISSARDQNIWQKLHPLQTAQITPGRVRVVGMWGPFWNTVRYDSWCLAIIKAKISDDATNGR